MSSEVYVGPHDEVDYQLNGDLFARSLLDKWQDVKIFDTRSPEHLSLEWDMQIGGYVLSCSLDKAGQTLALDGATLDEYAAIAIWFRQLIPDQYEIFLTETDGDCDFPITRSTTVQEVIDACM